MSTAVSNSASYPHVFAHKHVSLPPSGFYCANSRTTETSNGPTPLTPPQPRLLRDYYSLPHTVACPGCPSRFMTRFDTSPPTASIEALPIFSVAGEERTLRVYAPIFQLSLSTLITPDHVPTLLCLHERYEECGACSGRAAKHDHSATIKTTAPPPCTQLRTRAPYLATGAYNDASSLSLVAFMAAESHLNPIGITPLKTPQLSVAGEYKKKAQRLFV